MIKGVIIFLYHELLNLLKVVLMTELINFQHIHLYRIGLQVMAVIVCSLAIVIQIG